MVTTPRPMTIAEIDGHITDLWGQYKRWRTSPSTVETGVDPFRTLALIDELLDLRYFTTRHLTRSTPT